MIVLRTETLIDLSTLTKGGLYFEALDVAIRMKRLFQAVTQSSLNLEGLVIFIEATEDYATLKEFGLDIEKNNPVWVRRIAVTEGNDHYISLFTLEDGSEILLLVCARLLHERLAQYLN